MSKTLDDLRARTAQAAKQGKVVQVDQRIEIHANHAQQKIFMLFTHPADHIQMTLEQAVAHGLTVLAAAIGYGAKFNGDLQEELESQIARAREICAKEIAAAKKKN